MTAAAPSAGVGSASQPCGCDADAFRQAMRRLASGVSIVASRDAQGIPCGIAMTAVMSLSFDPPSMLIAVNRSASLLQPLLANGRFSINILDHCSEGWCREFVRATPDKRFAPGEWAEHVSGVPIFRDALASVICEVDQAEPFGSHYVIRGLVQDVAVREPHEGLIYLDGRYARPAFL